MHTYREIKASPAAISRWLAAAVALLLVASFAGQLVKYLTGHESLYGLIPFLDVDNEKNLPTFFSGLLLLFAASLLGVIAVLKKVYQGTYVANWALLCAGFLLMTADEFFGYHEQLVGPMRTAFSGATHGIFYFGWVIPGILLVLVLGLVFFKFLVHLAPKVRWRFVLAAALYLGGAIGMELVGGRYAELYGMHNLAFSVMSMIEEGLEMIGVVVFIRALLDYLAGNYSELRIRFGV